MALAFKELATKDILQSTTKIPCLFICLFITFKEVGRLCNSGIENGFITFRGDFLLPDAGTVNLGCTWNAAGNFGSISRNSYVIIQAMAWV